MTYAHNDGSGLLKKYHIVAGVEPELINQWKSSLRKSGSVNSQGRLHRNPFRSNLRQDNQSRGIAITTVWTKSARGLVRTTVYRTLRSVTQERISGSLIGRDPPALKF